MPTKNGNKVGTTELAHKVRPSFAESIFDLEYKIRHIINIENKIVKKFFFKLNVINFMIKGMYEIRKIWYIDIEKLI